MPPKQDNEGNFYEFNDKHRPSYSNNSSDHPQPSQYNSQNDLGITNGTVNPCDPTAHTYDFMMMNSLPQQKPDSHFHDVQQPAPVFSQSLSDPTLDVFLSDMHDFSSSSTMFASNYYPRTHQQQQLQQQQDQQHIPRPHHIHSPQQPQTQPVYSAIIPPAEVNVSAIPAAMTGLHYDIHQESNLPSTSPYLDILMSPFTMSTNGSSSSSSNNNTTMATPYSTLSESYFPSPSSEMVTAPVIPSSHNSPTSSTHSDTTMVSNNGEVENNAVATKSPKRSKQQPKNVASSSKPSSSPTPQERSKPTTPSTKPKTAKSSAMYKTHSYENVMTLSDFNVDSTAYSNANNNNSKKKKGHHNAQSHSSISTEPLDHDKVMEVLRAKILRSNSPKQQTTSITSASTATSSSSSSGSSRSKASPELTIRPPNTYPSTGVLFFNLKNRRRKASMPRKAGSSSKGASPDGGNGSNS